VLRNRRTTLLIQKARQATSSAQAPGNMIKIAGPAK
jgi:hypothetical protein